MGEGEKKRKENCFFLSSEKKGEGRERKGGE